MPRSNWKGTISFGLVSIPIVLFNSVEPSSRVSFRQINKKTGAPIKYKRVDAETEKEVAWEDIGKGYQYDKELILPVEENELKQVAGENARTIAIEEFIEKSAINFINVESTYYLVPDKKGEKGYVLLREALKKTNKIGIAKVILSTKEYLAAVSVYEDALVMYILHYNDEIRDLADFNIPEAELKKYKVTNAEVEIAKKLITSMTAKWKPEKFKDEYKEAVDQWVEDKINHLPKTKMAARSHAKKATNVLNFVDLLKKSLASGKSGTAKGKVSTAKLKKRVPVKTTHARRHSTRH